MFPLVTTGLTRGEWRPVVENVLRHALRLLQLRVKSVNFCPELKNLFLLRRKMEVSPLADLLHGCESALRTAHYALPRFFRDGKLACGINGSCGAKRQGREALDDDYRISESLGIETGRWIAVPLSDLTRAACPRIVEPWHLPRKSRSVCSHKLQIAVCCHLS